MADGSLVVEVEQTKQAPQGTDTRQRILALSVVLLISFSRFIVSAFYYMIYGVPAYDSHQRQMAIIAALISEASALLLLWFVLSQQGRSWRDIGWKPSWSDILPGIALAVLSLPVGLFVTFFFQMAYHSLTGHFLAYRSIHGMLGGGISILSVVFVLLNPFFEELIVRGYTMSEVAGLSGNRIMAILLSVLLQMSYHVYQGLARCIGLAVTFTLFSIYFSKKGRIAPVVLAHFCHDAYALMRLSG